MPDMMFSSPKIRPALELGADTCSGPDRTMRVGVLHTHQTLVLGRDEKPMAFPLTLFTAKETVNAMLMDRVDVVQWSDNYVLRGEHDPFRLPMVVRLKNYRQDFSLGLYAGFNRYNLFIRDEGRCQYSGRKLTWGHPDPRYCATVDHVTPTCRGGLTMWDNVVLASEYDNHRKGHKPLHQTDLRLRHKPWEPTGADLLSLWATSEALNDLPDAFQPFLEHVKPTLRVQRIRNGELYTA